ncbi:MAG: proton-conducting transporter transmembrane domain-containing protein [Thermoleophilia bacterium]
MTVLILILTPLLAALASLAVRKDARLLQVLAALAASIELAAMLLTLDEVWRHGNYGWGNFFSVDALGAVVLLTVGLVGTTTAIYSIGYLKAEVEKQVIGFSRVRQYFVLFHLFLLAMFFAIATVNPIMMWIAIEATTLSTAFLISFYNKPSALEAAWKYLIVNSIGLLLGFFGTLLFLAPTPGAAADSFVDWSNLVAHAGLMNPTLARIAFVFVLIGYGTKAGLSPMHTWLPDAHGKAPSPISALLSGALLNVALLAILRFKIVTDGATDASYSQHLLIFFGLISILISAFIILVQQNYKRLFAYSSIEHMGIAALGFGFGGFGVFAALLHMIYHSLTKSVLFYSAGNILLKYGTTKIAKVRGVLGSLPVTGVVLVVGFLAITGIPPFGIFITEFYILSAGVAGYLPVVIGVLALLALAFVGFMKHTVDMVFGEPAAGGEPVARGESNRLTVLPAVALLLVLVTLSFYLPPLLREILDAAAALVNG